MNNLVQTILDPANDSAGSSRQLYRIHQKNGQPFALFPANSRLQSQLASLLPAQSGKARLYRQIVRWAGLTGFGFPRETEAIEFPENSALVSLIRKISHGSTAPVLLPGNPNGVAPRLVIVCLDVDQCPVGVIKAGHSPAARDLVRREHVLLEQIVLDSKFGPAPRSLGFIEEEGLSAFAMSFVAGSSPSWPPNEERLETFLSAAIRPAEMMRIDQMVPWSNLQKAIRMSGITWDPALEAFAALEVHPCLLHGDFAPWNVRERTTGIWTAIDWERGERNGIPGWDWLHFSLQPAILVKKWPFDRILDFARSRICSPGFLRHLGKALPGPVSAESPKLFLRSYFLYNWHVLKPSEGREVQEKLARWAEVG